MSTETVALATPYRTIKLPALGSVLTKQHGIFGALQAAKPGSSDADHAIIIPPGPEFEVHGQAWGGYGKDLPGAACLWDGWANTEALLASKFDHPIIDALRKVRADTGINDLYLPSLREIKALFANGCTAFDPDRYYLTSTQYSRYLAYLQHFGHGYTSYSGEAWDGASARFARRCSIESLID